ncbi:MAG: regulatory YrvL family protein [Clostridioides difficile]|nr:regulatory YrvL family protein [Clostridioides sp.]MBS5786286.1 regulatory YrvL family protein [Clostridioides difficile]
MFKIDSKRKIPFSDFLYLIVVLAIFFGLSFVVFTFVGIGFLSFLGFEYESVYSVMIFFLIYFCITGPIDFACTTFLDVFRYANRLPYWLYKLSDFVLDFTLTFLTMNILDEIMTSISIPLRTEVLFALLSHLLSECSQYFNKNGKKKKKKKKNFDENNLQ